eukprot:Clim_evm101s147 gene=Clim_evmTU101s147
MTVSNSVFAFLATGMLLTGAANTIMTKLQDRVVAPGRDGKLEAFNHPALQTWIMFLGEFLCLLVFKGTEWYYELRYITFNRDRSREIKIEIPSRSKAPPCYLFALPTLCDMTATTLMNIGLLFTTASVYQMLRGAMVLFTAIFSVIFLKRKLTLHHYVGLFGVVTGIVLVGMSSMIFPSSDGKAEIPSDPLLGNTLIFGAQVIVATQFVVEEKVIGKYSVPALQAVGMEGFWGLLLTTLLLPVLQYVQVNGKPVEDTIDAFVMMEHSVTLVVTMIGSALTIAVFNFFGVSVTKKMSATHRTTIDSMRTLIIWLVALMLGWESFNWLQLLGFAIMVYGTFTYNEILALPGERKISRWLGTATSKAKAKLGIAAASTPPSVDERAPLLGVRGRPLIVSPSEDESSVVSLSAGGIGEGATASDMEASQRSLHRSRMEVRIRYYQQLGIPEVVVLPDFVYTSLRRFRDWQSEGGLLLR